MKSFRLGLTGSIGMGKTTAAQMFAAEGCAVWDADAAVHRLYVGSAVPLMQAAFPQSIVDGAVSRAALKKIIADDPNALKRIEEIVHPLVRKDRELFSRQSSAKIVVFDIPLLFETSAQAEFDAVICVTVTPELQRKRVMERGSMTLDQFELILTKQMPNDEKCALSDYVVETDTIEHTRAQVQDVIADIKRRIDDA
jgi:dephospho-CoA kinase